MPLANFIFQPPVIAHRGASALAPENTLAAFQKAKDIGARWVEFDVMLAACGQSVVFHDETLQRTTQSAGGIVDYPYEYLQTLDAGSWFHPHFGQETIPTFAAVLKRLIDLKLNMNIEIKSLAGAEEQTVKTVLSILQRQLSQPNFPSFFISSFSIPVLKYVRQYSADVALGFLMHEWQVDWQHICAELSCQLVDVNEAILTPLRAEEIKSKNKYLLAYTVNDPDKAKKMIAWGVDAVFSDCPLMMLPMLKQSNENLK